MATVEQQPIQQAPPSQSFEAVPLRELKNYAAPVDCPLCGERARTQPCTKGTPVTCLGILAALCIASGLRTIREKYVEHTCSKCGGLLAIYHTPLQPSSHGPIKREGGGETEVIAFAK